MVRISAAIVGLVVLVFGMSGCAGSASTSRGDSAPDDPKQTLKQMMQAVGDGRSTDACRLLLPGAQAVFASENNAKDCDAAMDAFAGRVTDGKKFATYDPSGLKIDGDTAKIGGACAGWDGPVPYPERPGITPDDLGQFMLKKTDKGWFVNDYQGERRFSSCGG